MVKIKIIRHSERLDFSHPFYWLFCFGQYWADAPLTNNGYKSAYKKGKEMVEKNFHPKYIYTSPYTRTMATATEIKKSFPQAEIIIEPLLSEYQPFYKHSITLYPDGIPTIYEEKGSFFCFPESGNQFSKRVQFIMEKIIEKNDSDLIIVTHGAILKQYIIFLQKKYPDLLINIENNKIPYLTIISFEYDIITKKIIENTIKIE
ncbi:MAG: phosphoglycerate mutase family protein [Thermoplasmata archaeon]